MEMDGNALHLPNQPHNSLGNAASDEKSEIYDLLNSWNLPTEVFGILQSKNVSIEILKYMKVRHIDELFTTENFATKILFEHHLTKWQKSFNESSTLSMDSSISGSSSRKRKHSDNDKSFRSSNATSPTVHSEDISVASILNCNQQGKVLMDTYKKNKILHPAERTHIVHRIIQYYIENERKLSVSKIKSIAEQIIEVFPTENMRAYFIGRGKFPPKGKLWDRYQCQLTTLKKLNLYTTPRNPKVLEGRKFPRRVVKEFASASDLNKEELEKIASTLKHLRNWEEVIEKWKITAAFRRQKIDESADCNLHQILKDWPLYKYASAPELVEIDFNYIYFDNDSLFIKWDNFIKVVDLLYKERIKDCTSKIFFLELLNRKDNLSADTINFHYMQLLHSILVPSSKTVNKKRIKYSIKDSQNAFAIVVPRSCDIDDALAEKRKLCLELGTCLQPFIIAVGESFNLTEFYVALDNIKFKFSSYLAALQYCFKVFYVLNLQYSQECCFIWIFIQQFFFGIANESQECPIVETFIGDINKILEISFL